MLYLKIFFVVCTCVPIYCKVPVVKVEDGSVVGLNFTLLHGKKVHAYLGIPYAAPPISDNRFESPKSFRFTEENYNATYFRSPCIQLCHHPTNDCKIVGSEDCLYLNIFTPIRHDYAPLLPVLVYIHGGAFMFGSGNKIYPDYLMRHENETVFVTLNYRLGIFGFFSTYNPTAPGNYGLKDQVAALQWIKRNIKSFNGDPELITIFGNSAGGASVHYHYFSPSTEGLFYQGISSSGTVLNPWARPRNVPEKSVRVAALLNCPTDDINKMMQCLRGKSAEDIIKTTKHFLMWKYCPFTPFGPVIEPPNPNAYLTRNPKEMLQKKEGVKNIPWMCGLVEKEGLYPGAEIISNDIHLKELNDKWFEIAPNLLAYNYSVENSDKDRVSAAIKRHYFGDKAISRDTKAELIQMLGDRLFYNDMTEVFKLHRAAVQETQLYCYNFMYRGKYSPFTHYFARNYENYGTGHGDDQFFIINSGSKYANKTGMDLKMVDLMTEFVIAFMTRGKPVKESYIKWIPLIEGNPIECLGIYMPEITKMNRIGNHENNEFWLHLLPSEYPEYA